MPKTILGIGAHYDDGVFGISGTLLKAVRKNHRVVILSLIGDYSNWKPAAGRHKEIVAGTVELGREYGVESGHHRRMAASDRLARQADGPGAERAV
ncbi:MAG: hypothetical protein ACKV2Q_30660 [Planctomycetaceae bacterium]